MRGGGGAEGAEPRKTRVCAWSAHGSGLAATTGGRGFAMSAGA